MLLFAQLRPEFVEAVDAANTSWWFVAVWIIPPAMIFPSVVWRWGGCISAPLAVIGCYAAFVGGYWNLDRVIAQQAETDAELEVWAADTDRAFAPFLVGPVVAVIYPTFCLGVAYAGRSISQLLFTRKRSVEAQVVLNPPLPDAGDENPYRPPRET